MPASADPLEGEVSVTAVLAHHWSSWTVADRRMALWCGVVIRAPERLVCGVGYTGYCDGRIFRDFGERFVAPGLVAITIGARDPRWFMAN